MILKEAVNNTIKYAGATKFELLTSLNRNKPLITIRDNGKGFDELQITEGNGLKNMKRRSAQINYTLKIESQKEIGTAIYLLKK